MNELILHTLSTIRYRFNKSVRKADAGFGSFAAGYGVRTPEEIITHMHHVLLFGKELILEKKLPESSPFILTFLAVIKQFNGELNAMEQLFSITPIEVDLQKKLIQGPLSDILTHIGQIAMLSRMHSNPIPPENFSIATI